MSDSGLRSINEIKHGRYLSEHDPEYIWGWGTPAGQLRAKRRATLVCSAAELAPGRRVLEIGCGTGLFTSFYAESGANIVAVDISPDLIALALERQLPSDRVKFLAERFEDCDVHGPFDAVIGNSILHHLNLEEAWPKIFTLLRRGGRLSFAEPNMLNPQIWAERHFRQFFPQVSPDETAFVRFSAARELRRFGFDDIRIQPFDWMHPAVPAAAIPLVRTLGAVLESIPGAREFSGSLLIHARKPNQAK